MTTLALFFLLCTNPSPGFFPGYLPIPAPEPGDEVVIPLPNVKPPTTPRDPILTA